MNNLSNKQSDLLALDWTLTNVSRGFDLRDALTGLRKNRDQGKMSHVYVTPDEKYVVKIEETSDFRNSNVLRYGTLPGIEKSGVRIHAWAPNFYPASFGLQKLNRQMQSNYQEPHVIYVLDHASYGNPDTDSYTLEAYIDLLEDTPNMFEANAQNAAVQQIRAALKKFYITTQAFHGDLHSGNIMLNLRKDGAFIVIDKVVIIDYGNMIPFKSYRATPDQSIDQIWANGHRNYRRQVNKINNYFVGEVQVDEYKNNTGRVGRSNRNMARARGFMQENTNLTPLGGGGGGNGNSFAGNRNSNSNGSARSASVRSNKNKKNSCPSYRFQFDSMDYFVKTLTSFPDDLKDLRYSLWKILKLVTLEDKDYRKYQIHAYNSKPTFKKIPFWKRIGLRLDDVHYDRQMRRYPERFVGQERTPSGRHLVKHPVEYGSRSNVKNN